MAVLLLIGISFPNEMKSGIGHVACTLGGVNYESRGGRGCLKGSAARGAAHEMFKHHFHLTLTDDQARRAKAYADSCVGNPYMWGGVPDDTKGGDCSGYMSGVICAATGQPRRRLFATGSWQARHAKLGFKPGFGGGAAATGHPDGRLDRPYPGSPVKKGSRKSSHVRFVQARLNFAARDRHPDLGGKPLVVDGDYGSNTDKVVRSFQRTNGLQQVSQVGPKTWRKLNDVR